MKQKIYLYIKTSPKGLKYLGKTIKDPFKYIGSGLVWLNHIKKHKIKTKDIITEILFVGYNNDEIKEKGTYYSQLYNIVESEEWANLKIENGDGGWSGWHNEDTKKKMSEARKGKIVSDDIKKRMSDGQLGKKHSEDTKKKMSESKKKMSDETKEKIRFSALNRSEEYKKKMSDIKKGTIITEDVKLKISQSNIGKKRSEGTKRKMSESKKNMSEETKKKMSLKAKERWAKNKNK